jgi:hypothetical protein
VAELVLAAPAPRPPLGGIDEISIPANATLIFEHSALRIPKLYIHSGANAIQWAYHLNTVSTPTIGGEVIQVLSATVGPMTISGQTAGLRTGTNAGIDTAKQVKGWRDVGDRHAYTPNDELREIVRWFRDYMTRAGALVSGQQFRDEAAVIFTYPERGWKFYIQPTKIDGFRYDSTVVSPEWSITAEVVSDNALDYFGGVTMNSYTDDLITDQRLLTQIGLSAFSSGQTETANPNFGQDGDHGSTNPFLNPDLSPYASALAKTMGDNFKALVAAWSTGDFMHFGFGSILDTNANALKNVDAAYTALFGTTFFGSLPGNTSPGSQGAGSTVYGGPANPNTKDAIILDLVTSFEAVGIPGKVPVAVVWDETGGNFSPDARQPNGDFAMGLFQTFPLGKGGAYSKAALTNAINNKQDPVTKYYPSGTQISDAVKWWVVAMNQHYPNGIAGFSDAQLAAFAAIAQGHGNDGYAQKVENLFGNAQTAINAAAAANSQGGAASGVRLGVINWAYKLIAYFNTNGKPTYSEGCRRDVENITPGDFSAMPTMDCSASIALLYAWGTNNNRAYGLNNGTFNGTTTQTIWNTWRTRIIDQTQARAGDIIVFGKDGDVASQHAEMFVQDYAGDGTLVFSFGSNPPKIAPFSQEKTGAAYRVFRILP